MRIPFTVDEGSVGKHECVVTMTDNPDITLSSSSSSIVSGSDDQCVEDHDFLSNDLVQIPQTGYGSKKFTVVSEGEKYNNKFKMMGRNFVIKFNKPHNKNVNRVIYLADAVREIHDFLIARATDENDFIGVSIRSPFFALGACGLSYRPLNNFLSDDLWELVGSVTQSNQEFKIDENFILEANYVNTPVGSGHPKRIGIDISNQKSFVTIKTESKDCLPRALVVAEAYLHRKTQEGAKMYDNIKRSGRKIQKLKSENLLKQANVILPKNGCGIPEIKKFQEYYAKKNIAIVIFDKNCIGTGDPPFFDGREYVKHKINDVLYICYSSNIKHYDVITNLVGVIDCNYFCINCNKKCDGKQFHRCKSMCSACLATPPCEIKVQKITCTACNRFFYGEICFQNHLKEKSNKTKTVCESVRVCKICDKLLLKGKKTQHVCGITYCKKCKSNQSLNHLCYMQPVYGKFMKKSKKIQYIFFDFECRQDTSFENHETTKIHIPNLCVAHVVCSECMEYDDINQKCISCGDRELIFTGDDTVKDFVNFSCRNNPNFDRIICLAHNARGYDNHFVLNEMVTRSDRIIPEVILNGQNIICMKVKYVRFIDSLNYFHMKLSALPAAFGLPPSTKKGYFPHLFNTIENQDYNGELPDVKFYAPDSMIEKERNNFFNWYNEQKKLNYQFIFQKEIIEYCKMDVEILRRSCLAFRKMFLETGQTDPFDSPMTIASACSLLFRTKFLKRNTISLIPAKGYRRCNIQSQKAVEWLLWCEHEADSKIIHAARAREYRISEGEIVDGFLSPSQTGASASIDSSVKGIIYEFQGCYFHGCLKCFQFNRDKIMGHGESFNECYENTIRKVEKMRNYGYTVKVMWECEWEAIKLENPNIREFIESHPLRSKITLNPRDAFFGGRTENFVTSYNTADNEKILYTDICSLYPYICKRGRFPIGHPKIYVGSECDELTRGENNNLANVEGLIKCRILPPRNLYLPLLPVKMHGKLLFPLCQTCCKNMNEGDCTHEKPEEREFLGVWVVDEVRKALQVGYFISEIFIIWKYEITCYDQCTGEGGLFAEYINAFLKIKQESSGWPEWCTNESKKEQYLIEYEKAEGIRLEREKIGKNAGMRALAKLCLNSFWGKMGQRDNLRKTEIIDTRKKLLNLLHDSEKNILHVLPANQEILYVQWESIEEAVDSSPNTNVVIAAYVTAQARLKLYEYMERLGERLLYVDTDSCIFVTKKDNNYEYTPHLGSLLGDMTDELTDYGTGSYIINFLSGGPKFYAYRVLNPSTGIVSECCKVKGITLNFENSIKINFDTIQNLIEDVLNGKEEGGINMNFRSIRRLPTHEIVTRDETKTCNVVLTKRQFVNRNFSLPYGFKKNL